MRIHWFGNDFFHFDVFFLCNQNTEKSKYIMEFRRQQAFNQVIKVALVGQPNAGKSALLNALLARERSIVDNHKGIWTIKTKSFV